LILAGSIAAVAPSVAQGGSGIRYANVVAGAYSTTTTW
jgi:hypothetical protein